MGIAQFFSSSPLGKLVDRIGPRKVLIYSMIYEVYSIIPQAYVDSVYVLGFIRFLQGFGLGGMLPALNTYLASKTPKEYTGTNILVQSVLFVYGLLSRLLWWFHCSRSIWLHNPFLGM